MLLEQLKEQANKIAETDVDMSTASKGGERYLLPEGVALGRMVEYIEFGKHPEEYKGEVKSPAMQIRIGFALYGEGYQKEDGSPRVISTYQMKLSNNEKSKSFKLFKNMNAKKCYKNFAQMLGEPFLIPIVHTTNGKGTWARIDLDNIRYAVDPVTKKPYNVPMPEDKFYRVFLWNNPTKEQWDSIHIDSNNFLQEMCLQATNFKDSPLDKMLNGSMPELAVTPDTPEDTADTYENIPW